MKHKIKIDVVSDVVCPWCYIGKRRLEKALETLGEEYDFELEYHPFELNPEIPAEGVDQKGYLTKKFGGESSYHEITRQVSSVARQEGLDFNFEKQKRYPNTRKAHTIIQLAKMEGKQPEVVESFYKAYFSEGIDLSKDENILKVAEKAGIDPSKAGHVMAHEKALSNIALAEQEVSKLGITGVPFFIINSRYGISGAQTPETFVEALQEIGHEMTVDGASCDVNSKNC